jgi:hypothetical protein
MATRIARPAVRRILATWTVLLMGLAGSRSVEAVPIISVGSANAFLNLPTQGFEIESGQITVTGDATPAVPEPATLVLMTSGIALLARYRVRRRSNHQRDAEARS